MLFGEKGQAGQFVRTMAAFDFNGCDFGAPGEDKIDLKIALIPVGELNVFSAHAVDSRHKRISREIVVSTRKFRISLAQRS